MGPRREWKAYTKLGKRPFGASLPRNTLELIPLLPKPWKHIRRDPEYRCFPARRAAGFVLRGRLHRFFGRHGGPHICGPPHRVVFGRTKDRTARALPRIPFNRNRWRGAFTGAAVDGG